MSNRLERVVGWCSLNEPSANKETTEPSVIVVTMTWLTVTKYLCHE
jgi:hypothetical protein